MCRAFQTVRLTSLLSDTRVACALSVGWHPTSSNSMVSLDDDAVTLWDVATSTPKSTGSAKPPEGERFGALRWNPHHGAAFIATASGPHVRCWDTRSMEMTSTIRGAHGGASVRCLDFNPNKQVCIRSPEPEISPVAA